MLLELEIENKDRILIIAPHPDDECIGPGGLLVRYAGQCDVFVLTDGCQGQGDTSPDTEKVIRRKEFIEEMNHLGIHRYELFAIEDGTLLQHLDCLNDKALAEYTKIFVTDAEDEHLDHMAAYECVIAALKSQRLTDIEVYTYEVHSPMKKPTHYMNISNILESKKRLISFHKSQLKDLPYDILAEQTAQYRGTLFRMQGTMIEVYRRVWKYTQGEKVGDTIFEQQKQTLIYWTCKRWVELLAEGSCPSDVLKGYGYRSVAVYGYGDLGRLAVKELLKQGMTVPYAMDRRAENLKSQEVQVVMADSELTKPDAVLVTAVTGFENIYDILSEMGFKNIFSLRELVKQTV